jgi:hypothetical protein
MTRSGYARWAIVVVSVYLLPAAAEASKVKVWHHQAPADHARAKFHQAVLSSEGTLRLSHRLRPLAALDAGHVWDIVEDGDGNLYAATDEGKVHRIAADGKTSIAWSGTQGQALCLAASGGMVYAGVGPGGQIIRIDPHGAAKALCDTGEAYVWALVVDPRTQTLYAGTGPHGRIYRIVPGEKPAVFCTVRQEHVLCLARGDDGILYAGTDRSGVIYRISPAGKAFALFQTPQAEVRRLVVSGGMLYAGTAAPSSSSRGGASTASRDVATADGADESPKVKAEVTADRRATSVSKKTSPEDRDFPRGHTAAAPSTPSSGENSVYRIAADGGIREVFREKTLVLSLLREGGRCFVGTGMEGQLFEVDEASRERSEIARLDHGQVLCLCRRRDGSIVLGAGDPGGLYVLENQHASRGTVVSEVLDARLVSRWGSLRWEAETPPATRLTIATRSGNVAEPDDTWSEWSTEQSDATQAVLEAPPARYLQYRVTMTTTDARVTPALRAISLRYATANQAPEVLKIETPDLNAVNQENPRKLKFHWKAQDANEDDLTYSVYLRKEGWKGWVRLEDDLDKPDYEWDSTTTPDGLYRIKVVASDHKDNDAAHALKGEKVSAAFVVCHTPPAVLVQAGDGGRIAATATSPLARITAAAYAVDGGKWVNVFPTDGIFDSRQEKFAFKTDLAAGTHVLVLRVRDAAGNTGSADVVFETPAAK